MIIFLDLIMFNYEIYGHDTSLKCLWFHDLTSNVFFCILKFIETCYESLIL